MVSVVAATATVLATNHVLCCMCGIPIIPNAANTCATCLASKTDISKGISTDVTLHQCRGCQRWHKEAGKWIACDLESRELMALCLANVSGLRGADRRLVDAAWIWTEPHSMRLKVCLTIQREVEVGTILQQSFVVTYCVRNQQCIECQSEFRQGSWKSLVQVRQRVAHKRTFLYLEQLILKHEAHRGCLSIETYRDGMDFYFPDKSKSARFISFLEDVCPVKVKTSKKLVSTDDKNNIANFKYTNFVEICPLCKDDLLLLPAKLALKLGNISRLVLVKFVSNVIHLVDPYTGQQASMEPELFWRSPFRPLIPAGRSRLTRYVVLGKEPFLLRPNLSKRSTTSKLQSHLALVTVSRESDLGTNDMQYEERSHIGYLLKAGDVCLGYDLQEIQFVDDEAEEFRSSRAFSDVVVLRKLYGVAAEKTETSAVKRVWQLQRLPVDNIAVAGATRGARSANFPDDADEEDFMQEVEADRDMRHNINLYKSQDQGQRRNIESSNMASDVNGGDDDDDDDDIDDDQKIRLSELLESLALQGDQSSVSPTQAQESDQVGTGFEFEEGAKAAIDGIAYVARDQARFTSLKTIPSVVAGKTMGPDIREKLLDSDGQKHPLSNK
jgi:nonsense-mediated mRNA decay protein 3